MSQPENPNVSEEVLGVDPLELIKEGADGFSAIRRFEQRLDHLSLTGLRTCYEQAYLRHRREVNPSQPSGLREAGLTYVLRTIEGKLETALAAQARNQGQSPWLAGGYEDYAFERVREVRRALEDKPENPDPVSGQ